MSNREVNRAAQRMQIDREELIERMARTLPEDGVLEVFPGLFFGRSSKPTQPVHSVFKPAFCVIACPLVSLSNLNKIAPCKSPAREQTHDFISVLKQLGASGVIGTEVKVWTDLARPFGSRVLSHLFSGKSVGETFLEIRKEMLRRYNPLGLLYNYYSPANLHLHNPDNCNWCATHKPAAAGGG